MAEAGKQEPLFIPEEWESRGLIFGNPGTWNGRIPYEATVVYGEQVSYAQVPPDSTPLQGADIARYEGHLFVSSTLSDKVPAASDPDQPSGTVLQSDRAIAIRNFITREKIEAAMKNGTPIPIKRPTSLRPDEVKAAARNKIRRAVGQSTIFELLEESSEQ